MAGIGWALIYLKENELIEDDISEEIMEIDNQISCFRMECENHLGVMNGTAGVIAYVMARIIYAKHYKVPAPWIERDRSILLEVSRRIMRESKDLNALIYAYRFQLYVQESYDENDIPISLSEWMAFHTEMPEKSEILDNRLTGRMLSVSAHGLINRIKIYNGYNDKSM